MCDTDRFISAKEVKIPALVLPAKPLNPRYSSGLWEKGQGHQGLGMYRFLPVTKEMEDWPTLAHVEAPPHPRVRARLQGHPCFCFRLP